MRREKITVNCQGEELILSKNRAIYWTAKRMMIVSDLHIGKSAHFRKAGIPVPGTVGLTDLQRLTKLITEFNPAVLVVTGDMFHNNINSDADLFMKWRQDYPDLKIVLIKGNHDDLKNQEYELLDIQVYNKEWICPPFRFIHDKPKTTDEYFSISGHIHPGVAIYGKARQQLKFPCFYFSQRCAILPAFSVFTGLSVIKPEEGDRFFGITPEEIIEF